jgi:hypothetical protein
MYNSLNFLDIIEKPLKLIMLRAQKEIDSNSEKKGNLKK